MRSTISSGQPINFSAPRRTDQENVNTTADFEKKQPQPRLAIYLFTARRDQRVYTCGKYASPREKKRENIPYPLNIVLFLSPSLSLFLLIYIFWNTGELKSPHGRIRIDSVINFFCYNWTVPIKVAQSDENWKIFYLLSKNIARGVRRKWNFNTTTIQLVVCAGQVKASASGFFSSGNKIQILNSTCLKFST